MKSSCFLFFLLCSYLSFGQKHHVLSGKVVDEKGVDVSYGDVILRAADDSAVIKITYVDEGNFVFDSIEMGAYLIEVSGLGYERFRQLQNVQADVKLNIILTTSAQQLDAVTVTETRNLITNKKGNQAIEVANTILAAQPTAIALLSMLPKIQVSIDGESVNVIGKGSPLIYMDNRRISSQELIGIPVSSIQRIELINNPSAKYEAEGRVVIRITRKKDYADGLQIQLHEQASWQRNFNNHAGINASLKRRRIEVQANVGFRALQPWEGSQADYVVEHAGFVSGYDGTSNGKRPQFVAGCGLYYQVNEEDHLSFHASGRRQNDTGTNSFLSSVTQQGKFDEIQTVSVRDEERGFTTANLNYNNVFKKSLSNLFVGAQYSNYLRAPDSRISNNINNTEFIETQFRQQSYEIDRYTARIDFEKSFKNEFKLEIGTNFSNADAKAKTDFLFIESQEQLITKYDYLEKNYAAYTQLTGAINKLEFSAGIRFENLDVQGGFQQTDTLVLDRENAQVFPRLMLNIPIDSNTTLTFNFTTSVNRPHYLNASTISTYISPFLEFTRNANLQATIHKELSLNLGYKNQSLELSYSRRDDPVQYSVRYDDESNRVISFPQNLRLETSYALSIVNPIHYKFWRATNYARLSMTELQDDSGVKSAVRPQLYAYTNQEFTLPHEITLGLNIWGRTKQHFGLVTTDAMVVANLSVSKIFNNKLTLTVGLNDLFRGQKFRQQYTFNQVQTTNLYLTDQHAVSISVRYSFGKKFKSSYKNKEVDEGLNRMN